jgi:PAS domain S-box-containing protein
MTNRAIAIPRSPAAGIASDSIFRHLVDSVTDYAIFILDPRGYITTWNAGAERLEGYKHDEIIGKHFSIFYPQDDLLNDKPGMELKVASQKGRLEDEGWRVRKDGSRFWANVVITRITDDEGKLLGFGKITRDLTERRYAEQRFRLLIEGVTDYAIYSLDSQGFITSWNSGAQRIKGYTTEEILGRHFSLFYTPEDAAAGMPQHVLKTACEEGHFEGEGWRVRKDGSRFWSSVVVTPLRDESGNVTGFSKITRDVTDRRNLLEKIKHHAAELELRIAEREQTNAELEAFSYSVSHDLRAPLRAVEGFSDALREEYSHLFDETAKDYLQQIINASGRMNRLVQDLLNYSRLSRTELVLQNVNVRQAIDRAIQELPADQRALVSVTAPPGTKVVASEATFVQVLINLLTNGLKFHASESAPRVEVEVSRPRSGWIRISVKDNGIGIAPEHQERIFQVFERLHGIEAYPGTGIGLAIVKRGIERMGGSYGLHSELGKGSTFWIELRAVQEQK